VGGAMTASTATDQDPHQPRPGLRDYGYRIFDGPWTFSVVAAGFRDYDDGFEGVGTYW
jgi:hypothetical protein